MSKKICIFCGSKVSKKNGFQSGKQLYKCYVCGRQFVNTKRIDLEELWRLYSSGKQTYVQL